MARKEKLVEIEDRGNLLTFKVTEMPAVKLEKWIMRAFMAINGTANLPEGVAMQKTAASIIKYGMMAFSNIEYEKVEPLYDELLSCCALKISDSVYVPLKKETVEGQIEDVQTLFRLRMEALSLNLDFLGIAVPSHIPAAGSTPREKGQNTPT